MAVALVRPGIISAWKGLCVFIATARGDAGESESLSGYYFRETRFLRTCRLELDGERPWLCESSAVAPDTLDFAYTHPEIAEYGGGGSGQSGDEEPHNARGIPQRSIDIRVRYRLGLNHLRISATFANRARHAIEFETAWRLDADFADIQEAQGRKRQQNAGVLTETIAGGVHFTYQHERLRYRTSVEADHDHCWDATSGRLVTRLTLEPGQATPISLRVSALDLDALFTDEDAAKRQAWRDRWSESFTDVASPGNRVFEAVLANNVRDFASFPLLDGQSDEWLVPQAGMPLYPALFGRDAVTAGWQAGYLDRGASLDAALTRLGRMQSDRDYEWRDEEPGRIPYQVRRGPLAVLDLNPYAAYYADYASPLVYVIALANLYSWTGDKDVLTRHWDTARRILDWARNRGDLDGDGYLEYQTRSRQGTKNQGWKDSGDAIIYADGTPVPSPIATCEIQGYWYAAQQLFGALNSLVGADADARAHYVSGSRSEGEIQSRLVGGGAIVLCIGDGSGQTAD